MSKWPTTSLRGKIHVKHGFPFKGEHFQSSGTYVVLTPGNFHEQGGFKRNAEKDKCYSETFPEEYLLKKGDIVVAMTEQAEGLLGSTALIPESGKFLHNQRLGLITAQSGEVLPEFIYHLFKTFPVRDQIRRTSSGSKVKHTSPERIYDVHVPLPPVKDQAAIAEILTTIDAKIALNQRINFELEGMAKLLYDYWFVQYDFPLSAAQAAALGKPRLAGRPYRTSGGKMVFNLTLKREIPEGWESGTAKDLFVFNPSISIKKGAVAAYLDMDALPTTGFMTKQIQRKEFNGGTKFTNGDVLVARITPCLENGKTGLVSLLEENEPAFGSTEFIVLRGRSLPLSSFACCLSRSEYFRKYAIGNMTGTSGRKRLEAPILEKLPLSIPATETLVAFEKICSPLFTLMTEHTKQNQELTTLRDWLLPMLMNGQVRVSEP